MHALVESRDGVSWKSPGVSLEQRIKVSLDELRMQTLGAQILLGFQLGSVFQTDFAKLDFPARAADAAALFLILITFAMLLAPAADHRIVNDGRDNPRTFRKAERYADLALFPFALAIGCDCYVVLLRQFGSAASIAAAFGVTLFALFFWYGLGNALRTPSMQNASTDDNADGGSLHGMIEQMLTEARVVLPGVQALLGFQFANTLSHVFSELPPAIKEIHYLALVSNAFAIALLIAPAAVHRIAFAGRDSARFHRLASILIACALAPLAIGISADTYVVVRRMLDSDGLAIASSVGAFMLFVLSWYVVPVAMRGRGRAGG